MATFGITLVTSAGIVIESVDVEHKSEFKRLIGSDGTQFQTHAFDGTFDFSVRGKGANPFSVGVGNLGISAVTGKAFVTSAKRNSKNDDFIGWEASGASYQYAT
jgi:hypothetical protein